MDEQQFESYIKKQALAETKSGISDGFWAVFYIGGFIFIFCLVCLFVQVKFPYSDEYYDRKEAERQEEREKEKKADNNSDDTKESADTESDNSLLSAEEFVNAYCDTERELTKEELKWKYSKYNKVYNGKTGIAKKNAEKILKKILYYYWDNNIFIDPLYLGIVDKNYVYKYKVYNIRQKKNGSYVIFFSLEYDEQINKITISENEEGVYEMKFE